MGYGIPMYSPLRQINKSNVKRLVPIWSTNLMSETGELSHPAIYNGVMYIVNGHWTFALDVATGPADLAHAGRVRPGGAAHLERGRDHARHRRPSTTASSIARRSTRTWWRST